MQSPSHPLTQSIESQERSRPLTMASYFSTTCVTGLNVLATFAVSAILARTWSVADFMLFTTLNRYLSLIYCVTSFCLGFGIVKCYHGPQASERRMVLPNALLISGGLCGLAIFLTLMLALPIQEFFDAPSLVGTWAILGCCLWVTGQSLYHVVLSYIRGMGRVRSANILMFAVKSGLVIAVSLYAYSSRSVSVPAYYGLVGLSILAVVCFFLWEVRDTFLLRIDCGVCRRLTSVSASRCLDAILKHCQLPILITLLYVFGEPKIAGGIVIVAMLVRGLESLFQPLVLMVLADAMLESEAPAATSRRVQASWDGILLVSVPAMLALAIFAETLFSFWLGEQYRELGSAFRVFSLGLPAILGTVLLRGNLDARYRISPLAITGVASIVGMVILLPVLESLGVLSLQSVAMVMAVIAWCQFAALFALLRLAFGTRFCSFRSMQKLLRHLVHRAKP